MWALISIRFPCRGIGVSGGLFSSWASMRLHFIIWLGNFHIALSPVDNILQLLFGGFDVGDSVFLDDKTSIWSNFLNENLNICRLYLTLISVVNGFPYFSSKIKLCSLVWHPQNVYPRQDIFQGIETIWCNHYKCLMGSQDKNYAKNGRNSCMSPDK